MPKAARGILIPIDAGNNQVDMLPKYTFHLGLYFLFFRSYRLMAKLFLWSLYHLTTSLELGVSATTSEGGLLGIIVGAVFIFSGVTLCQSFRFLLY